MMLNIMEATDSHGGRNHEDGNNDTETGLELSTLQFSTQYSVVAVTGTIGLLRPSTHPWP